MTKLNEQAAERMAEYLWRCDLTTRKGPIPKWATWERNCCNKKPHRNAARAVLRAMIPAEFCGQYPSRPLDQGDRADIVSHWLDMMDGMADLGQGESSEDYG